MLELDRNAFKKSTLIYCVHHAITSSSDGYAVRGHAIAFALFQAGITLKVLVAPSVHTKNLPFFINIGGVAYIHLRNNSVNSYLEVFRVFKPNAVLVASNWRHAQPVQAATKLFGVPFWYEARGFWELSECARNPSFALSSHFQKDVDGEVSIASRAAHVFTLNRHMADEWIRRGVPASKISLVPNGLAAIPPAVPEPEPGLCQSLGLDGRKVIAYIGSFSTYEGLDDLIIAFSKIRTQGLDARLLLVGSLSEAGNNTPCQSINRLLNLALQHGVADYLVTTGRVPPQAVSRFYPLIDVMVIPRRPVTVCEIVSPLKPLEPAAFGVQLLMSSVAPLADLQVLGTGVHLFEKGSVDSLANQLVKILSEPTPLRSAKDLYPQLENFLWCRSISPLLEALSNTPSQLKQRLSWQ